MSAFDLFTHRLTDTHQHSALTVVCGIALALLTWVDLHRRRTPWGGWVIRQISQDDEPGMFWTIVGSKFAISVFLFLVGLRGMFL